MAIAGSKSQGSRSPAILGVERGVVVEKKGDNIRVTTGEREGRRGKRKEEKGEFHGIIERLNDITTSRGILKRHAVTYIELLVREVGGGGREGREGGVMAHMN